MCVGAGLWHLKPAALGGQLVHTCGVVNADHLGRSETLNFKRGNDRPQLSVITPPRIMQREHSLGPVAKWNLIHAAIVPRRLTWWHLAPAHGDSREILRSLR